ncbi:unnamed protein product, partial [marine sediment metagenome]
LLGWYGKPLIGYAHGGYTPFVGEMMKRKPRKP